jgi:tyrosyl-tRNA synthetase
MWRGFIRQLTHADKIENLLTHSEVTVYAGFDPTAPSLHIGHLLPIMALSHMQRYGHTPIALMGGGTGMIGDPSGKTETRKILSSETIRENVDRQNAQMKRFMDFDSGRALLLDNAEWITSLNYVSFLREIGSQFSVNRMLTCDCFKLRMDKQEGLSFLEFNYMLLQAYDFLMLYRKCGCTLQVGGDDQWSNILAGIDLVRRLEGEEVYGLTLPLLETAQGAKMGKTEGNAVWLSPELTTPFDFYQYWRNVADEDVGKLLRLYTFLSSDDIIALEKLKDQHINRAKKILAFEITRMVHGEEEANDAQQAAEEIFEKKDTIASDSAPMMTIGRKVMEEGIGILTVLFESNLVSSKSQARRLIEQGGAYLNELRITDVDYYLSESDFTDGCAMLRSGKKKYVRLLLKDDG